MCRHGSKTKRETLPVGRSAQPGPCGGKVRGTAAPRGNIRFPERHQVPAKVVPRKQRVPESNMPFSVCRTQTGASIVLSVGQFHWICAVALVRQTLVDFVPP